MTEYNPSSKIEIKPFSFDEKNLYENISKLFMDNCKEINELREELRQMRIKMAGMQLQVDDLKKQIANVFEGFL